MRFASFTGEEGESFIGVCDESRVLPFAELLRQNAADWPQAIALAMQPNGMQALADTFQSQQARSRPLKNFRYGLPVSPQSKILCVGLNYTDHAKETGQALPEHPVIFTRYFSSFVPHAAPVIAPRLSEKFDYEAELTIVIGRKLRHAAPEEALRGIFGYTIGMDGTLRDVQKRHGQWTLGKNFDASGALGPYIVSADALPENACGLSVQTRLNGTLMQNGNTADMVFTPVAIVSLVSGMMTLNPGDLILTGTPAGVGFARTPPVYLKAGDRVETRVEGVGTLVNEVAGEK